MNIRKALSKMIWHLPLKKNIILESSPTMADNTGAVYKKMIENGFNHKYNLIWLMMDQYSGPETRRKNVYFVRRNGSILDRVIKNLAIMNAKAIIDCNVQIEKIHPDTFHLFLTHGSLIKNVKSYYNCVASTDYMLNQSPNFTLLNADQFAISPEKLVTFGFPRNDDLFDYELHLQDFFGDHYKTFVMWLPTYRQMKSSSRKAGSSISIPVIHDEKQALEVNQLASDRQVLIIVKPHPDQDLSFIKDLGLSNIVFIGDDFFSSKGINLYQFLSATDALITDYSSVLYDYLLTGKPIGLTFEDYDSYQENPGFAVDTNMLTSCAYMLDSPEDFNRFFEILRGGRDDLACEREKLKRFSNYYTDSKSAQRVFEFICEHLGE